MTTTPKPLDYDRRRFLRNCTATLVAAGTGALMSGCASAAETVTRIEVPRGFRPRIVARSSHISAGEWGHPWHSAPDGGGCIDAGDGGWIYVSNCEGAHRGGASALRFDARGTVVDSYPVLTGTLHNCAGGVTPWGTWLSCEEINRGLVWECDPFGKAPGVPLPALGVCEHESAAVDPLTGNIYLTEDEKDGRLYRFSPSEWIPGTRPDLSRGALEMACVRDGRVSWVKVPDPTAESSPLRKQVSDSTAFRGGEGIALEGRMLRFTSKWDNRIWQLNLHDDSLEVFDHLPGPAKRVDNLVHTPNGEVLIAEDGSGMRILYYPRNMAPPVTLVRLPEHRESEITGIAFDPAGRRLYFSSQRGSTGRDRDGLTFEVAGDFHSLARGFALTEWRLDHASLPA